MMRLSIELSKIPLKEKTINLTLANMYIKLQMIFKR